MYLPSSKNQRYFFLFFFLTDSSEGCLLSKITYTYKKFLCFFMFLYDPILKDSRWKILEVFVFTSPGSSCYKKRKVHRKESCLFCWEKWMPTKKKKCKKNPGRLVRFSSPKKKWENGKHLRLFVSLLVVGVLWSPLVCVFFFGPFNRLGSRMVVE